MPIIDNRLHVYNTRNLPNQLNTQHFITKSHNFGTSPKNNGVFKDPNDEILANAVEQMWKSGLKNLKTKITFNSNQYNQRDSAEFSITTVCFPNGSCTIRQTPCNCDTTNFQKECNNQNSGFDKKNVINKSKNSQNQDSKTKGKSPTQTKKPTQKPKQTVKPVGGLSDAEVKTFRKQLLDQTNVYRNQHGVNKLTINEKINVYAQEWANHLAKSSKLEHRQGKREYGENLFASSQKKNLGKEAATSWYNEIFDDGGYNFKADENKIASQFTKFGHMTQLLWKNSKEMGVGISKSRNGMYIVVANYNPPGNVREQFKKNVLPKVKH